MKQSIGFIGAGMMGSGICKSLLKAGHPVTVIAHRNRAPIDELVKLGAREVKSAPELAQGVDIVMLCVDRAETVERIISEITPALRSGQFIIDVTTGKPETSKRIAAALATKGVTYVDAPVTGGPAQAAEGKLAILAGGSPEVFEKLKPIFDTYTVQAILFGPTGAGITAKLLNNFVTQSACQVIMQAYRAARRNDVNWDKLYNAMLQGAARSGTLERIIGNAIKGNYRGQQFSISNAAKDVEYAGDLIGTDPDGARIHAAVLSALKRPIDAGLGDRFVSEMLDPEVERKAR
ncbi:MAG: NAD(P)-dependent oxidoreductase [Hyphomicrobiaceae bacterium]|jgi:3-hydroxyisobutyrate dehydrogenase-like beta-hydroxyacid dehydrogenase